MTLKTVRRRFAFWLMDRCYWLVERVDRAAVPKVSMWTFTFERGRGAVIVDNGGQVSPRPLGCRLMYLNDDEYDRAWSDSRTMN